MAITLVATVLGPADTLALAQQGAKYGFFFAIFPLMAAVQHLIAGRFFADKINREAVDSLTVGDIIGKYYGVWAHRLTGLLIVLQALAFTGLLCLAGGQVLYSFLGVPVSYGVMGTALFVGFYTYFGGMTAVLETDKLQATILAAVVVIGLASAVKLVSGPAEIDPGWLWNPDPQEFTLGAIITLLIAYFLGEALLPVYAARGLLARDARSARRGFYMAALGIAIWYLVVTFIGISSRILGEPGAEEELVIVDVLSSLTSVSWIQALLVGFGFAVFLAVTHSTFDSILHVGALGLSRDLLAQFFDMSEEEQRNLTRRGAIIIALAGSGFAAYSDNLIDILIVGYTMWVPTIVVPLGYALLRQGRIHSRASAWIAIVAGVCGLIVGSWLRIEWLPSILMGLVFNMTAFGLSEKFNSGRGR